MRLLVQIAIGSLSLVGGVYAALLLIDCYLRWKKPTVPGAVSMRHGQRRPLHPTAGGDWWSQAVAAVVFLAVATTLVATVWQHSPPLLTTEGGCETESLETVKVAGLPPLAVTKFRRDSSQPGEPIVAVDLAFLPITNDQIRGLLEAVRTIEFLNLTGTCITDDVVPDFHKMPCLRALILQRTAITDAGCRLLGQISGLEDLSLSTTKITDCGLERLACLKGLRSFDAAHTAITDRGLEFLERLPCLEYLDVGGTRVTRCALRGLRLKRPSLQTVPQ